MNNGGFLRPMDIMQELNKLFCGFFDDPDIKISEETTSNDVVGWDSLSHMAIIFAIELHFDINFTQSEALEFKNIGDLLGTIDKKIAEKKKKN
jgi:acyl carrier protein